jgi:gluconate kinase
VINGTLLGYSNYLDIQDLFLSAAKTVAEDAGKPVEELNAFVLREAVATLVPQMLEKYKAYVIVCNTLCADTRDLVSKLRPHIDLVFEGVS